MALWQRIPQTLSVSTDIVGYQIFKDFDIFRYIYGYYFIALLFPLLTIALFLFLSWRGPLRYAGPPKSPMFPLTIDSETAATQNPRDLSGEGCGRKDLSQPLPGPFVAASYPSNSIAMPDSDPTSVVDWFWAVARVALPATVVVIEIAITRPLNLGFGTGLGYASGGLYLAVLVAAAIAQKASGGRGAHSQSARLGHLDRPLALVARANSLMAILVVPLLFLVSRSTVVILGSGHHVVRYPWLPSWLVFAATSACLVVWRRASLKVESIEELRELEAKILTWIVGPVFLFLVLAEFQGAIGLFQAFDDSQSLAAPQLIFHHGLFPWKDIYLIHGLLYDVFDGNIGMVLFGNTRWGSSAGLTLLVYPINSIALYGFTAYFCKKNRLVLVGLSVAIMCNMLQGNFPRFLLVPILLVLFDLVIRRASWKRCWVFMTTLVIAVILTPEEALFVPCLIGTLFLFELTTRQKGHPLRETFARIERCTVAGATLIVAWAVFLAATGSLRAFVDFFLVFAQGHNLEGGFPTGWSLSKQIMITFEWVLPTTLWLATVWRFVAKLRLRSPWAPADWVMIAAATCTALYFPKALDRADPGHVLESYSVAVPLLLLWTIELLRVADGGIGVLISHARSHLHLLAFRHVATFGVALATVIAATTVPIDLSSAIERVPGDFHPSVPVAGISTFPRLGYAVAGSVDTNQIRELGVLLDRYAGRTAPVFDYSNEIGVTYYLLNRVPGTRYFHSEVVQTHLAQQQEINDLRASRPPVVIFSNTTFGLLDYDGVPQMLRSFSVSQYLYAHYTPLLDVSGQLLLLRNDLLATAPPVPPGLLTSGLYFDTPSCTFGDIPNFFSLPSNIGQHPRIAATSNGSFIYNTTVTGWAVDRSTGTPARSVLAFAGGRMVASAVPTISRPDVAAVLHDSSATKSGFTMTVPTSNSQSIQFVALDSDGTVTQLSAARGVPHNVIGDSPMTEVTTSDGQVHRVVDHGLAGGVNTATRTHQGLVQITIPDTTSPGNYSWLELTAPGSFGSASFVLSDGPNSPANHTIQFNTLPRAGRQVYVGVGSCLQWHGYGAGKTLYLARTGGGQNTPISVKLVR